jgi:hypothetical protein
MSEPLPSGLPALAELGEPDARAAVTFVGTDRIEVLRFPDPSPDPGRGLVHYAALCPPPDPPLILTLRTTPGADTDGVVRQLAVIAASPQVEGVRLEPGAALDLGAPLWPGAPFTAVLVDEAEDGAEDGAESDDPGDTPLPLRLLPLTPAEAAWRRARGTAALRAAWRRHGTDPRDPARRSVPLTDPATDPANPSAG